MLPISPFSTSFFKADPSISHRLSQGRAGSLFVSSDVVVYADFNNKCHEDILIRSSDFNDFIYAFSYTHTVLEGSLALSPDICSSARLYSGLCGVCRLVVSPPRPELADAAQTWDLHQITALTYCREGKVQLTCSGYSYRALKAHDGGFLGNLVYFLFFSSDFCSSYNICSVIEQSL